MVNFVTQDSSHAHTDILIDVYMHAYTHTRAHTHTHTHTHTALDLCEDTNLN